jgi:hypothetical protein
MLIWKVIAANPGITREEIWKRVEHSIPEGYAVRRHSVELRKRGIPSPDGSALGISKARSYILTYSLQQMRVSQAVTCEGQGKDRLYTVARELHYRGNPDAIDETGTKAGEHMAMAEALRTAEQVIARAAPGRSGPVVCLNRKEYAALGLMVKALRAKAPK